MSRFTYVCVAVAAMAFLALGAVAQAEIVATMDSSDFIYGFEFTGVDDRPDNYPTVDIDGNLNQDMSRWGSGGTISGGIMTLQTVSTEECGYSSKLPSSVWHNYNVLSSDGFTIETKVKIITQAAGYSYVFALYGGAVDEVRGSLRIGGSKTGWTNSPGTSVATLDTNSNSDVFHIFRMAFDPATGLFAAWRDGVELSSILTASYTSTGMMFSFGDGSGLDRGTAEVDYVRFTKGAYAPIPEPSTIALLATGLIGLLCYAWRKRK